MSVLVYPSYKDSGVVWLDKVPAHWDIRRVRWICEIRKRIAGELGHDVLSITQQGIKIKDVESNDGQLSMDYSKYQFVEIGDFAMNHMDLLTGYIDIASVRGVTSPDYRVFAIRDPDMCYDKYLLYLFQMGYKNKILYAYGQGSSQLGRWRLPTEQFNDLPFPLPPLIEQKSIATFLDRETAKIDALVAEKRRLVELLLEKRQALISHAVTKGLHPNVSMKLSGIEWLGAVPSHWAVVPFSHAVMYQEGPGILAVDFRDEGTPLLRVSGVQGRWATLEGCNYLDPKKVQTRWKQFQLQIGDLLISASASMGTVCEIGVDVAGSISYTGLIRLKEREGVVTKDYVRAIVASSMFSSQVDLLKAGATIQHFGPTHLSQMKLVLPPIDEQGSITNYIDEQHRIFDTLTSNAQRAIELLTEWRGALISAAVTGKIDVRECAVEQAA